MKFTPEPGAHRCALIVATEDSDRALLAEALGGLGSGVHLAEDFHGAKLALAAVPPDLLVTELRLGAYNGLHLVLRGRAVRPRMKAIVLTRAPDPVLQEEAAQMGAEILVRREDGAWLASIVAAVGTMAGTSAAPAEPAEGS